MCKKVVKLVEDENVFRKLQNSMKEFEALLSINHPSICRAIVINSQEKIPRLNENYRFRSRSYKR